MDYSSARLQTLFSSAKKFPGLLGTAPLWIRLSGIGALFLVCWSIACMTQMGRYQRLKALSTEVSALVSRGEDLEKQKMLHKKMEEQIRRAPKNYIKEHIETLPLLQGERQRVLSLAKQYPDNAPLRERVQFLESGQNQISFDELHFNHRVQMDLGDLRKFLEAVEGDRYDALKNKPFLVIKKFDLLKCYEKGDEKVYSIYAELL